MSPSKILLEDENGSALIVTLLILVTTLTMGIFATSTSVNELQIAGGDLQQKIAFYEADGATEYGAQLLEENIACAGFEEDEASSGETAIGDVQVERLAFWANEKKDANDPEAVPDPLTIRAFYFPSVAAQNDPHTEVYLAGNTGYLKGSAMQLAAGYEGIGKGSAGSGVKIGYDVINDRYVHGKRAASVTIGWRHVVGQEEECKY